MNFSKVFNEWKRMCEHFTEPFKNCEECPLCDLGCDSILPKGYSHYTPEQIEEKIMQWAKENPEPVYPTWYEWLTDLGAVTGKLKPDVAYLLFDTGLFDPIPADIAEKLGIEPEEG